MDDRATNNKRGHNAKITHGAADMNEENVTTQTPPMAQPWAHRVLDRRSGPNMNSLKSEFQFAPVRGNTY